MFLRNRFAQGFFCFVAACGFATAITARAEEGHSSGIAQDAPAEARAKGPQSQPGLLSLFLKKVEDRQKLEKERAPFKAEEFACVKSLAEIHQAGLNDKNYEGVFSMNDWIFFPLGNGYYGIREYTSASGERANKDGPVFLNHFFITNGKEELKYRVSEISKGTFSSTNSYLFDVEGDQDLKVEWQSETGFRTDVVKPFDNASPQKKELAKPELSSKIVFGQTYSLDSLMRKSIEKTFQHFNNMASSYRAGKYKGSMASKFVLERLDQEACRKAGFGNYIDDLKKFSEGNI